MRSETRGFSVSSGATFTLRTKENLLEYRFIPEPDLPSLGVTRADVLEIVERHGLERRMEGLPERAAARLRQLEGGSIPESCVGVLSNDAALLRLFEGVLSALGGGGPVTARRAAQWLTGPFLGAWRAAAGGGGGGAFPDRLGPEQAALLRRIADGRITERMAKAEILPELLRRQEDGGQADAVVDALIGAAPGNAVSGDSGGAGDLRASCASILADHPREVDAYVAGRDRMMKFFVGTLMKATKGRADAAAATAVFRALIDEHKRRMER